MSTLMPVLAPTSLRPEWEGLRDFMHPGLGGLQTTTSSGCYTLSSKTSPLPIGLLAGWTDLYALPLFEGGGEGHCLRPRDRPVLLQTWLGRP